VRFLNSLQYSKEELQEMSLIELAYELLANRKQAISFKEIMDEVAKLKGLTEKNMKTKIAQFYTDLNIDGRFLAIGDNQWGLRIWYPVDQVVEEIINPVKAKKKKKAKKKAVEEVLELDGFDDPVEAELEELDIFDEDDDDDDDDLLDDDLDDDLDEDEDLIDDDLDEDLIDDDLKEEVFEDDDEEEELDEDSDLADK
jgi:DNA-directed RNA polymerase subunit delta